jgi:ribosomal protein S18 acetylase RimI-like enzyme
LDKVLTYAPVTAEQYDLFLQMMWDDGEDYWENTMRVMQMTWEEYSQIFRTRGEVQAIYREAVLAGFYWIEERGDTLHLHGLILKSEFQGQGIGTTVLNMLAERYSSKMDKIELGVYQTNSGAIRLYEKLGYQITRNLDELHFYIMQKPLNPPPVP